VRYAQQGQAAEAIAILDRAIQNALSDWRTIPTSIRGAAIRLQALVERM